MMGYNMEAPERIWADRTGIEGAVEIGCWAGTIRHFGGVEYIRADLAATSAPAEVEGLTDTQKIERMADLNWKPASQYWKEQHDAKATALTALQAENERLRKERDDWQKSWREVLSAGYEMKARAEKAEAVADQLAESLNAAQYASFDWKAGSAALAAHAKLKEGV